MLFNTLIPRADGSQVQIPADLGGVTFVVGPNGVGKSSLMHKLYLQNPKTSRRISAHRQNWLSSNSVDVSAAQKRQQENNMDVQDTQDHSRWRDDFAGARAGMTIYDLLDAENIRARAIATEVTKKDIPAAEKLAAESGPIQIINDILVSSNIPITIAPEQNDALVASKNGGEGYSVAELSDGERNALLIAGRVLTAPAGTLFLIDEPERHLHRSIISPLLTQLFAKRTDCAFIVSTHELELSIDNPASQAVLVRSNTFADKRLKSWEIDILAPRTEIDEALKLAILGGRRKLLFVEGENQSLDRPLYALLFPGVSIHPSSSCRDVQNSVEGLTNAADMHWLKAFGIIDRDQIEESLAEKLRSKNVYPLGVYSVEGLYYHPDVQAVIAKRQVTLTGGDVDQILANAKSAALLAAQPHVERLAARMTEKKIKDRLLAEAPTWKTIQQGRALTFDIDVTTLLNEEKVRINALITANDLVGLIQRYPIRETPMIDSIVKAIGLKDRAQYEAAVRKAVTDEPATKTLMLGFFGNLQQALA